MDIKSKVADLYVDRFTRSLQGITNNANILVLENKINRLWDIAIVREAKEWKKETQAFFIVAEVPRIDMSGKRCHLVVFSYREEKDKNWIKSQFLKCKDILSEESIIEVPVIDQDLAVFFCKYGFYVESVGTIGNVEKALKSIEKRYPDLNEKFSELSIDVEPFVCKKDIPDMIKVWKDVFQENPEYFFCGARKSFLKEHKLFLENKIERYCSGKQRDMLYVFRENDKILGYCDLRIVDTSPWSNMNAGTQFCLSRSIRGKGIGTYCYWLMLQDLNSVGITTFSGNTSNPAVMKLSLLMERSPVSYMLVKGRGFFENNYFFNFTDQLEFNR